MIIPEHLAYVLYIYLSVLVSVYSSAYIISIFHFGRKKYRRVDGTVDLNDLTILIPVYNENVQLFSKCLSMVKNQGANFIVVGDGCGKPYDKITIENGGKFVQLKHNVGKKNALASGMKLVKSKYVMFLDSDTLLPKNAALKLLEQFDERTGGVSAEVRIIWERKKFIYYPSEMLQRLRQISFKAMSNFGRVLVLNGQCAIYRTNLIKDFMFSDMFLNTKFMGRKMVIGDDMNITKHINRLRYKTKVAQDVVVKTKGQDSFKNLVKQSVRWSRSGYINFGSSIKDGSLFKNGIFYAFSMIYVYTLPLFVFLLLMLKGGLIVNVIVRRGIIGGILKIAHSFIYTPRLLSAFIIPYIGIKILSFAAAGILIFLILNKMKRNKLRFLSYGSIMLLVMFFTALYAILSINKHDEWLTR